MEYVVPALLFALMGLLFALLLALASRVFAVKQDPRIGELTDCLPGANCGGCGYTGCAAYAEAVAKGEAKIGACNPGGTATAQAMGAIMGVEVGEVIRRRAQVMCSGVHGTAKIKYHYAGAPDCTSAARLGGGDKLCPNGCIGLGSCVSICPSNAISIRNGVAWVDPFLCSACGVCVNTCPKKIIHLVPYEAPVFVGCSSTDKGAETRSYCSVGCIGCKLCERACEAGAIHVEGSLAVVDYAKCTGCGACASKCPRKIIYIVNGENGQKTTVRVEA